MARLIRIKARRDGYRRAGIEHRDRWVTHEAACLTEEQIKLLEADPNLQVEAFEGELPAPAKERTRVFVDDMLFAMFRQSRPKELPAIEMFADAPFPVGPHDLEAAWSRYEKEVLQAAGSDAAPGADARGADAEAGREAGDRSEGAETSSNAASASSSRQRGRNRG